MKLKDLAGQFADSLGKMYGPDEAHAMFFVAIGSVLQYGRADYLLKKEEKLEEGQLIRLQNILTELQNGKPVQYVIGEAFFYGLPFKVSPSVLIPRPETEELVDWVIESTALATATGSGLRIIDIGTGSGCIAVSLKKNLPATAVSALDISDAAINVASANAALNQVDIHFIQADIRDFITPLKFDVIVSNPPYIRLQEKEQMQNHVLDHEPHLALFVPNEKPLVFYEAIADFAWAALSDFGLLFFEINADLGKETVKMLVAKSFINIELRKDMQGKDRMIKCQRKRI
jgi:release factor glutamine methyltransferase